MMNEFEFHFNEDLFTMISPFDGDSSADLFQTNLDETFSAGGSLPVCVPPGLVYVGDRQSLVIFERPPRYQKVVCNPYRRDKAVHHTNANREFHIPLPWQIYVGEFGTNGLLNALHIYFASDQITGINAPELKPYSDVSFKIKNNGSIYSCPLPNVYESNLVCLDKETSQTENTNLASKVNLMYSSVWDTVFNSDILWAVEKQIEHSKSKGYRTQEKFGSTSSLAEKWLYFWQNRLLADIANNSDPSFFYRGNIWSDNTIKLSEWFTTPSSYKLINTLQQLI